MAITRRRYQDCRDMFSRHPVLGHMSINTAYSSARLSGKSVKQLGHFIGVLFLAFTTLPQTRKRRIKDKCSTRTYIFLHGPRSLCLTTDVSFTCAGPTTISCYRPLLDIAVPPSTPHPRPTGRVLPSFALALYASSCTALLTNNALFA